MDIAIFDYLVTPNNPAGSCHRLLVERLGEEHQFTVFAPEFDNPLPRAVKWVRIRAVIRPLLALFVTFHFLSFGRALFCRGRFTLLQGVESNFGLADIVYAHFCHRWFLKNRWRHCRPHGLRRLLRWADHYLHSIVEPLVLRRARWIVVPSSGLARELTEEFPFAASKIHQIANPVDLSTWSPPSNFNRDEWRSAHGFGRGDIVLSFVALGHFERKGLPCILQALATLNDPSLKLHVIGGSPGLVEEYRQKAQAMSLERSIYFAGYQSNVRPFLWGSDLFVLPSLYEVFPLAALQAAAARLPIMVSRLSGVEDYLTNGKSCLEIEPSLAGVLEGLARFRSMSLEERLLMVQAASGAVTSCGTDQFAVRWREFYRQVRESLSHG